MCRPYEVIDLIEFQHCPPYHDKIVLHQKYIVECLSIRQIAREFSSSKEAVRVGLIRAGITLRDAHNPHGRQSQAKYGERRVHGTVVEFKKEEKVVKAVKQMREQGLSLRQIAKNLSAMGISTKCDGMKWHPEMITRILK